MTRGSFLLSFKPRRIRADTEAAVKLELQLHSNLQFVIVELSRFSGARRINKKASCPKNRRL